MEAMPHRPNDSARSATGKEDGEEVKEILRVDERVVVDIGAGVIGKEHGQEVKEVLGVHEAVGVEVSEAPLRERAGVVDGDRRVAAGGIAVGTDDEGIGLTGKQLRGEFEMTGNEESVEGTVAGDFTER
jgi:hypothetical protein